MKTDAGFRKFFEIKAKLEEAGIWHSVNSHRDGYLCLEVTVPGQRWEVEVNAEGGVEIEIFKSDGHIHDEEMLETLLREFSD